MQPVVEDMNAWMRRVERLLAALQRPGQGSGPWVTSNPTFTGFTGTGEARMRISGLEVTAQGKAVVATAPGGTPTVALPRDTTTPDYQVVGQVLRRTSAGVVSWGPAYILGGALVLGVTPTVGDTLSWSITYEG